jgi:hypothetical protein
MTKGTKTMKIKALCILILSASTIAAATTNNRDQDMETVNVDEGFYPRFSHTFKSHYGENSSFVLALADVRNIHFVYLVLLFILLPSL